MSLATNVAIVTGGSGVIGFTRSLAREVGPHGICFNAAAAGLTDTSAAEGLISSQRFDAMVGLRSIG
jgi:NAD(P)-dependent dehydrogenase (short-subunit alcohol dehydrogenase family)